jgi:pimeloyl-ACP methyl ester carboxylesterase
MISNKSFVRNLIAGTILALSILAAAAESPTKTVTKTGYAPANGLNLYYEIHGTGEPLVLPHGGAGAIEIFSSIMLDLSRNRQVIAVDLHAHRRTAHIAHSLSYKAMADDIADLIQWPVVLDKLNRLLTQYYDWSNEVTKIRTPTLLVFGHADAVRPAHVVEFSGLLGGRKRDGGWDGSGISNAWLAILPVVTHYNIFSSPAKTRAVVQFLDAGAVTTN